MMRVGSVETVMNPEWNATRGDFIGILHSLDPPRQTGSGIRLRFQPLDRDILDLLIFDSARRSLAVYPETNPEFDEIPRLIGESREARSIEPLAKYLRFFPQAACILQALIFLISGGSIQTISSMDFNTSLGNWFTVHVRPSLLC